MRLLLSAAVPLPAILSLAVDPRLQNLIVSVVLAALAYFFGGSAPKRNKHRDDYDSN